MMLKHPVFIKVYFIQGIEKQQNKTNKQITHALAF